MKHIQTVWRPSSCILETHYTGTLSAEDAGRWEIGLWEALDQIPRNTCFKLLLDLHGFEPEDIAAHKAMRNIIPELLAKHNMRPAFIDLFDEKPELPLQERNGIQCIAFANVHHDQNKMDDYRRRIGRKDQQFFTDLARAQEWLESL